MAKEVEKGKELCTTCGEWFYPVELSAITKKCWPCFQKYLKEFD